LEDLAMETGCWLYFAAQFPTSQNQFVHYASERLRNEGGELMNDLHQTSKRLFTGLMTARRRDTVQITAQLTAVQVELAQAKAVERAQAEELARLRAELREVIVSLQLT
ncbi:hypothetical protein MPER_03096, partial [Moniliophthora perniciosa FA553]